MVVGFESVFRGVQTALKDARRHPWTKHLPHTKIMNRLGRLSDDIIKEAGLVARSQTDSLLKDLRAKRMPVDDKDGAVVLDSYFRGEPPFRKAKARQDFPDAFILAAARRLAVPFSFVCYVDLDFMVYRAEAFSVPDWVHVEMGDFSEETYFPASGSRDAIISGTLDLKQA